MAHQSFPVRPIPGLVTPWAFVASPTEPEIRFKRLFFPYYYARPRPPHVILKALPKRETFAVYFIFCPDNRLSPHHHYTMARLKDLGVGLFVICACKSANSVPADLHRYADALYWKGTSGYDFSAYTLALEAISAGSPGATAFVLNDSMFGPFADLTAFVRATPWEFTGFTASGMNENHIQSYAFIIRNVTPERVLALRDVLHERKAYNDVDAVIWCQETRLARIAANSMSVGSVFYSDIRTIDDSCLRKPFELLDAGFPFMKRSLLGKMVKFQDPARVLHYLEINAHPLPLPNA